MDKTKIAELEAATAAAKQAAEDAGGTDEALNKALADAQAAETAAKSSSQEPIDAELEKERAKKRTEKEKAEFSIKKNADRLRSLGGDPAEALGISTAGGAADDEDDDNRPMTRGEFKKMKQEEAAQTSIQLAEQIEDPKERELTITYLRDRIKPSGDPHEDLRFARQAVNAVKSGQIIQETTRRVAPKTHSSGAGAPANGGSDEDFVPTAEEAGFMRPPFNMTKEQIIAQRPKS